MNKENINEEKVASTKKRIIWLPWRIHEVTKENDIKFRGPLSYRHLRIIGWLFLALGQIAIILNFNEKLNIFDGYYGNWPQILAIFGSLMTPLFLIAIFSILLNAKDGYRRLLILYSGLAVLVFIATLIVYEHYLVGIFSALDKGAGGSSTSPRETARAILLMTGNDNHLSFNLFIDLLICTLISFFINYHPTKYFQGKKIYIFRSFIVFPIAYIAAMLALKILSTENIIYLDPLVYPLLTTKTPISFLIFIAMALFIKNREKFFLKKGKTHKEFKEFEKTNVNSLHFSLFLSLIIVVGVILDAIALLITYGILISKPVPSGIDPQLFYFSCAAKAYSWGLGKSIVMLFIIPLVILFDYKKTYKDSMTDLIIPIVGVAVTAIIYIEGGYQVIRYFIARPRSSPTTPQTEPIVDGLIKLKDSIFK